MKRFGELLKRAPSNRTAVATIDTGTQAVCLVNSNSTQTSTCSPKLKALQQLNKSQSQQSMLNAPTPASSSNSKPAVSIAQSAASASFFHPNIRVPPAGRPNPIPILPRYIFTRSNAYHQKNISSSKLKTPNGYSNSGMILRPASAIVSAPAPSPVARLANYAKSVALTPGPN